MNYSMDQQKAIAIASARKRMQESSAGTQQVEKPVNPYAGQSTADLLPLYESGTLSPEQQAQASDAISQAEGAQYVGDRAALATPETLRDNLTRKIQEPASKNRQINQQKEDQLKEQIRAGIPEYAGDKAVLQEIGSAPELNELSMSAFKSSLGANLIGNDYELAQVLKKQMPDATFTRDKDLNLIAKLPSGDYYLNRPGFSGQDVAKFGTRAGLFALTGGAPTGAAIKTLAGQAGRAAVTEIVLQVAEKELGGQANAGDVLTAGVAAPIGQVLGEKVVKPAIQYGTEAAKNVLRGGEAGKKSIVDALEEFSAFGDTPTAGQAVGGWRAGWENFSSRVFGGGAIKEKVLATATKVQSKLASIADDVSKVKGDVEAGRAVQKGILGDDGFIQRFKDKSSVLWNKVDEQIGAGARADVTNTKKVLDDLVRSDEIGKMLNNGKLTQLKKVFDEVIGKIRTNNLTMTQEVNTTIPYADLKALRTQIGGIIGSNDIISDIPRSQLKRLYAGLSQDIKVIAEKTGATNQFKNANNFTRGGHDRIESFIAKVVNKDDLDKITSALTKGGEGIQVLNSFKRSLKPNEWEAVTANAIRKLGRANSGAQDDVGGAFSVAKLVTDWDKLGRAKNVLFSGTNKLVQYRKDMDLIVKAANRFKETSQVMANNSGTGQAVVNQGTIISGGAAIGTMNWPALTLILGGVATNKAASELMVNPTFVRWLASSTKATSLPSHLAKLTTIASSIQNKEALSELLESIKSSAQ